MLRTGYSPSLDLSRVTHSGADFLGGAADSLTQDNGVFLRGDSQDPSLFLQENWRVSHRLTLNLGLRWEYYPPYIGQNNTGTFVAGVQSTRFPSAPLGLVTSGDPGIRDGVLRTPWNTFAPRIGFAYDLFGDGATAVRGAYGFYYSPIQQQILNDLVQQPFSRSVTVAQTPSLVTPFSPATPVSILTHRLRQTLFFFPVRLSSACPSATVRYRPFSSSALVFNSNTVRNGVQRSIMRGT